MRLKRYVLAAYFFLSNDEQSNRFQILTMKWEDFAGLVGRQLEIRFLTLTSLNSFYSGSHCQDKKTNKQ